MVFLRLVLLLLALCAIPAEAIEPFTIKDIRVEGIQRTDEVGATARRTER